MSAREKTGRPAGLYTAEYLKREEAVKKAKKSPQYARVCGHRLAADNVGASHCAPCARGFAEKHPNEALPTRTHCWRGHDLAAVGLIDGVRCKACHEEDVRKSHETRRTNLGKPKPPPRKNRERLPGLRGAMEGAGIGYRRLAQRSGVPETTLRYYASCKARVPEDRAVALSRVLGVSLGELRGEG